MTRRTLRIAIELVEESDEPDPGTIDTDGEPIEELTLTRAIRPVLAKCGEVFQTLPRAAQGAKK